ncbi:Acg family FMN-binding oxidoreductase [uncultured Jatrophihabitans sp.]|uniref:Acg family FMN-binding oxidoreductase n=1 Tax=uncultured Jatrophihabitans sp. TaxID=1610747 RepID=UPI0035CBA23F
MTLSQLLGPTGFVRAEASSIVACASRAPSIHNTQPWRWTFDGHVLDLRADRTRQLHVADRDGHSLLISCGAAAELTALALRTHGWTSNVSVLPDVTDPDLLVRFTLTGRDQSDPQAAGMVTVAAGRRSERRAFGPGPVAVEVIDRLREAAQFAGVYAHFPSRAEEMVELAVVVSSADRFQRADPLFAAEVASWRRDGADDGIPDSVIPEVPAHSPRHTDMPLRDFEAGIAGSQLITAGADEKPLIAVIFTDTDTSADRLNAGRAMMRLMIQAELDGIASCPLSQSVDLLAFRTRLRTLMSWNGHPQMMLRLGHRPAGHPAPLTARRPVDDVLTMT